MPSYNRPIKATDAFSPIEFAEQPPTPEEVKPTTTDLIKAGVRLSPTAGVSNLRDFPDDPDFVPDFSNLPARYDPFIDELEDSTSEREFQTRLNKLDQELNAYDTLSRGGAEGMFWGFATGLADPITLPLWLLGPGKAAQSLSTGKQAAVVAGFASADAAIGEGILQATQDSRKAADSAISIGGSAVLGGIVGGLFGRSANNAEKVRVANEEFNAHIESIVMARRSMDEPDSVGAAVRDALTLKDTQPLPRLFGRGKPKLMVTSPQARLIWNDSNASRIAVDELVPHNVLRNHHLKGVAGREPVSVEIDQLIEQATVQSIRGVKDARRALRKRGIKMTENQIAEAVGQAIVRGDKHELSEVASLARADRAVYDEITGRLVSLGLLKREDFDSTRALSYRPRLWDADAIARNYKRFRLLVMNHYRVKNTDLAEVELEEIASGIFNTIAGIPGGRMPLFSDFQATFDKFSGRLKSVKVDIPDVLLEEFLVKDSRVIMRAYARSVVPELVLKERYGVDNVSMKRGEVFIESIEDHIRSDYGRMIAAAADEGKSVEKLNKRQKDAIADVRHILMKITGLEAPSNLGAANTAAEIRSIVAGAGLSNIVFASLSDAGNAIIRNGVGRFIKVQPASWQLGKLSKSAKKDFDALAIGMDIYNNTRMNKFADIEDVPVSQTAMSFGQQYVAPAVFKYTLANRYNRSAKRGTGVAAQDRIITDALRYEKLSKARRGILAQVGIDKDFATRIAKEYQKHGEKVRGVHVANQSNWDSATDAAKFGRILFREVNTTIVTPQAGDVPRILDNAVGAFVTQFKKTVLGMQMQVLAPMSQRVRLGDFDAMAGFLSLTTIGMMQEYLYMAIRNNYDQDSINREAKRMVVADWIKAGIERSGAFGLIADGYNLMDFTAAGRMSQMLGMSESSRWYFRSQGLGSFIPASGFVWEAGVLAGAPFKEGGITTKDLSTFRRMLPFNNAYYARWLFDQVEDGVAEAANLPEGQRRERVFARRQVRF